MKKAAIVLIFVFLAAPAFATPIFTGNPVADFGVGEDGLPPLTGGPGYYLWANNDARTSWSVRWTGADWTQGYHDNDGLLFADVYQTYSWAGSIVFSNNEGLDSPIEVFWDSGDGSLNLTNSIGTDTISYGVAEAGPHWDGFDFTLTGEVGDFLTFNLESDYFTLDNDGVYVGQDLVSVLDNSTDNSLFISDGSRQFEVAAPVPEPATLLLLGSGLVGLAFMKRRKK